MSHDVVNPIGLLKSSDLFPFFGQHILKVIPNGKAPATKKGMYDAELVDRDSLEKMVKVYAQFRCNAGLRLGDGLVVVDTDPRHGGDTTLLMLLEAFGDFPHTWVVNTPGGGTHHYFKAPTGFRKLRLGRGVEVLGKGQYCLIPGSQIGGKAYSFRPGYGPEDVELASLPHWILDWETLGDYDFTDTQASVADAGRTMEVPKPASAHDFTGDVSSGQDDTIFVGEVIELLFSLHPDMPRDHWVKVGMALSSLEDGIGDVTVDESHPDTQFMDWNRLWHFWSSGCLHEGGSEKYSYKDAEVQWKSFKKRNPHTKSFVSFKSLVYLSLEYCVEADFPWETLTLQQEKTAGTIGTIQPLHPFREGIMRNNRTLNPSQLEKIPIPESDNFKLVYNEVVRLMNFHSHEMAMAVTRQIFVTSCGMRGITASGRRLMFNPVLVGLPRTGKSTALRVFKDIMHAALPGYTCGWPDSAAGMQKILKDQPNVCMIGEEHGNIALAGVGARANEWQKKFHGFMLNLIAGATSLDAQIVKKNGVAAVNTIYVTSILNTTEDLLREAFSNGNNTNRGDGVTRRFTLFYSEAPKATRRQKALTDKNVSQKVVDLLLKLSGSQRFLGTDSISPAPPYNDTIMKLSDEADRFIDECCEGVNKSIELTEDPSIIPLMLETLDKIEDHACLLAYIDGRQTVTLDDVKLSKVWAHIEHMKMVNILETSEEFHMLQLIDHMVKIYNAGQEVSKRQLTRASRPLRRLLEHVESKSMVETLMVLFEDRTGAVNLTQGKVGYPSSSKFKYLKSTPKRIK